MPEPRRLVINTSPLLALIAATGDLALLKSLYGEVLVPYEVCMEIWAGGVSGFGITAFESADWLSKQTTPVSIDPLLGNSLDLGEAAVIQLALNHKISTVCIDEAVGRRVARLSGLVLTGSVGILLRAKREGQPIVMRQAIKQMLAQGIRLSTTVVEFALREAGEA